ncbi:LOW QUALITY PROTEIN: centrosomal protein of 70 kDa-like [Seriola lalandi dorsalis]|uniref:LOW QUALITY PROTEIN: centrosomal protein of 70 kDa-like n=1 Tax=Seriola lalandi dorsalis TaxID=1841481 RepID=UPI000C6F94B3|nr:LOW QUALITY PROTEIN: centrosomal protein of 70 kDa-like [Seriola lalandi dorsalis]
MEQQEQVEWDDVNKLLRHHGFKPVYFADPVENKNLSDLVLLDKRSADEIRATLRTMLTDSERRQALIQELIKSNNQLKEEVQEHAGRAARRSRRATELEGLLDTVKTRVQDLEDRYLGKAVQHRSHGQQQQLQREKEESQKRREVLEHKLSREREKATRLQRKLYFTIKEEERQTFQHICGRVGRHNSAADQQVLDVIVFYEAEMTRLMDELRSVKAGESDQKQAKKTPDNVTPSFRSVLKAHQEQRRESRARTGEPRREAEQLKQQLETKPTLEGVKFYKHKLRRLEGLNKHANTRWSKEDDTTESSEHTSDQAGEAGLCEHYRYLSTEVGAVVTNPSAPRGRKAAAFGSDQADFDGLLPALEVWAQQLQLLEELQRGLTELAARLVPGELSDGGHEATEAVKVEDMMLTVDTMLENTSADNKVPRSPTRYTLGSVVSRFQKLFDVTSLSGVYPRMNEVYARLGEMTNTMKNLRHILDLDSRAPPTQVANQVAQLGHAARLYDLPGDVDVDSIIAKARQHDEFFPPFRALVTDILQILGLGRLDDILPALKSLKQTAQ